MADFILIIGGLNILLSTIEEQRDRISTRTENSTQSADRM